MSTLHTINKSWHNSAWLFEQLLFASKGDVILLMEDAVLALQSPITLGSFMGKCAAMNITVVAQSEDCSLRGVDSQYYAVELISYAQLVALVVEHDKQVAW